MSADDDWRINICQLCWHDNELHDFGSSQRTPRRFAGKYICLDCTVCGEDDVDGS